MLDCLNAAYRHQPFAAISRPSRAGVIEPLLWGNHASISRKKASFDMFNIWIPVESPRARHALPISRTPWNAHRRDTFAEEGTTSAFSRIAQLIKKVLLSIDITPA